jgi:hypothetical protein
VTIASGTEPKPWDNRIYIDTSQSSTIYTVDIPSEYYGYQYGLLIYGDGGDTNYAAVYLFCTGISSSTTIDLTPIYKGTNAQTVTATKSGKTITLTFPTVVYGGIRMLFLA